MKLRNAITTMTAATLVAASMNLFAATANGSLGTTSTGTADVNLSIPNQLQISGLVTVALPNYSAGSASTANTPACVYSNAAGGAYYVTLTSANGAFNLSDGSNTIAYSVTWDDTPGTPSPEAISYNTKSAVQAGDSSSTNCSASTNAKMEVSATDAAMGAVPAGAYSDTITILVTPT